MVRTTISCFSHFRMNRLQVGVHPSADVATQQAMQEFARLSDRVESIESQLATLRDETYIYQQHMQAVTEYRLAELQGEFDVGQEYESALQTMDTYGLHNDSIISVEQVEQELDPKRSAIKQLRAPRLILEPDVSERELVHRLQESGLPNMGVSGIEFYEDTGVGVVGSEEPTRWKPRVVESYPSLSPFVGDDLRKPIAERMELARSSAPEGVQGVDAKLGMLLMMDSYVREVPTWHSDDKIPSPVDQVTETVFNDGPIPQEGFFYSMSHDHAAVMFRRVRADKPSKEMRFRYSVSGDNFVSSSS